MDWGFYPPPPPHIHTHTHNYHHFQLFLMVKFAFNIPIQFYTLLRNTIILLQAFPGEGQASIPIYFFLYLKQPSNTANVPPES